MKNDLLDLYQKEDRVKSIIQEKHGDDLILVERAMERILRAWTEFATQKQRLDDRLERARMSLVTRSVNSTRMALSALEYGYYQQAMALTRMVMEDQLVANDITIHTPTLDTLLDGKGRLNYSTMAKRTSPEAKAAWNENYRVLSEYSVHPRNASLDWLNSVTPDGRSRLLPGSFYDKEKFLIALLYLLGELVKVMDRMATASLSAEIEWDADLLPDYISVQQSLEHRYLQISEWIEEQLEEEDEGHG